MNGVAVRSLLHLVAIILFVLAGLAFVGTFTIDEAMGLVAFGLATWCAAGLVH